MIKNKKVKAFTLLELVVVMAIIAVLVGLSIVGIGIVQRSARDSQRTSTVQQVALQLEEIRGALGSYPLKANVTLNSTTNGTTLTINPAGVTARTVTLSGPAVANVTAVTGPDSTDYCYSSSGSAFSFVALLESGGTAVQGSQTACVPGSANVL